MRLVASLAERCAGRTHTVAFMKCLNTTVGKEGEHRSTSDDRFTFPLQLYVRYVHSAMFHLLTLRLKIQWMHQRNQSLS